MTKSTISKITEDTFLLDIGFGNIRGDVETLEAVVDELMVLELDMKEAGVNNAKYNYLQWHRTTKILSQLLLHTVENLDKESSTARRINEEILNTLRELKTEEKPSSDGNQNEGN